MTVYVDDMHRFKWGRYGRMKMSHMIADTEAELHAMAKRIGVHRKWYQGNHYDICLAKRATAVQFGAVEVTMRQLALKLMEMGHGRGNRRRSHDAANAEDKKIAECREAHSAHHTTFPVTRRPGYVLRRCAHCELDWLEFRPAVDHQNDGAAV